MIEHTLVADTLRFNCPKQSSEKVRLTTLYHIYVRDKIIVVVCVFEIGDIFFGRAELVGLENDLLLKLYRESEEGCWCGFGSTGFGHVERGRVRHIGL